MMYFPLLVTLGLLSVTVTCSATTASTLSKSTPLTTEMDMTTEEVWISTTTSDASTTAGGFSTASADPSTTASEMSTTPETLSSTTPTTSSTTTEWTDMDERESEKLVSFVVSEIQKLKMEHHELDECQELNLSTVLSGKKLASGKTTKYSVTLKVQPQLKATEECLKQNTTAQANMHPEICEADVTEGDRGGSDGKTLLRSTCLQVEELQE